jgi:LysM repeat protein
MGRWGLRQITTLCMLVWVMAACGPMLPATPLELPAAHDATLTLRTAAPPLATPRTPGTAATRAAGSPTPRPNRSPEASPTPFYYTVQPGDTLAGIAAHFGITLADLRAANGSLPADAAYAGQVLLIPPASAGSATQTLVRYLPTLTPLPLPLDPPTCYPTPADEVLCLGWIVNALEQPLTAVTVQVMLVDEAGRPVAQRATALIQQVMPVGIGAPYAVRFTTPPRFAAAEAVLLSAEPITSGTQTAPPSLPAAPLTVLEQSVTLEDNIMRVQGMLRYDGQTPLGDVVIIATLRDTAGHVTGYRVQRPPATLEPGDTLAVDMLITPLNDDPVQPNLYAEGRIIALD